VRALYIPATARRASMSKRLFRSCELLFSREGQDASMCCAERSSRATPSSTLPRKWRGNRRTPTPCRE